MHNKHFLNIVRISYSVLNNKLKANANKDPWRPTPPPESLVLICIFIFVPVYFSALCADRIPMESPVHVLTPLFSSLEAGLKIQKWQDSQAEEV